MVRRLIVAAMVVMTLGVVTVGATGFDIDGRYLSIMSERRTCDPPPVASRSDDAEEDTLDDENTPEGDGTTSEGEELREDGDDAPADAEVSQAAARTLVECR